MKKVDIKLPTLNVKDKPRIKAAPALNLKQTLAQKEEPDPLGNVDYNGELEHDAKVETDGLLEGFRQRALQEQDRFTLATDSEFWFAVGFQSREQKEQFLREMGWTELGDKYLDGTVLAAAYNIHLVPVALGDPTKRVDRRLRELT
jgi:hypothetical protein